MTDTGPTPDAKKVEVKKAAPPKPIDHFIFFSSGSHNWVLTDKHLRPDSYLNGVTMSGERGHETPNTSGRLTAFRTLPAWNAPPSIVKGANARFGGKSLVEMYNAGRLDELAKVGFDLSKAPNSFVVPSGPNSPLGFVTFMFNNPHSVYFHTTNNEKVFDRLRQGQSVPVSEFSASRGCFRLPYEAGVALFAALAPGDPARNKELIESLRQKNRNGDWANPLQYDSKGQLVDYRNKSIPAGKNIWVVFTQEPLKEDLKSGLMSLTEGQMKLMPQEWRDARAGHGRTSQPPAVSPPAKKKDQMNGWNATVTATPAAKVTP